jgi:predicted NUDIX family NTP pyrophosphohydrolase
MPPTSAGILLYRTTRGRLEVLLVHPGGPVFSRRDVGSWGVPKGEYEAGEEAIACAIREFEEELGQPPPDGPMIGLGEIRQKNGKRVTAWGLAGDLDADAIHSNTFTIEWPPRSGRMREFPEIDRAAWLSVEAAGEKIIPAQRPLVDRLVDALGPAAFADATAG